MISSYELSAFNNAGIDVDDNHKIYDTRGCIVIFLSLIMKTAFIFLSFRIVLHGQLLFVPKMIPKCHLIMSLFLQFEQFTNRRSKCSQLRLSVIIIKEKKTILFLFLLLRLQQLTSALRIPAVQERTSSATNNSNATCIDTSSMPIQDL